MCGIIVATAIKESGRKEIEAKLATMGDYVKIDYLARCLQQNLDFDTRKFVLLTLSKLYESRNMYAEAAKLMRGAADINTTFQGKIGDFLKSAELYSRAGVFDEADISIQKALASANTSQRPLIKKQQKEYYMTQAKLLMQKDKRTNAMKAYEKILALELSPQEKTEVQNILMGLYEKLGKVREFYNLKRSM
jgi:tetratricopeptide (TPR) repeat protein